MIRIRDRKKPLQDRLAEINERLAKITEGHGGKPATFERDCFLLLKLAYSEHRMTIAESVIEAIQNFARVNTDEHLLTV